jgi:hypothetical protein
MLDPRNLFIHTTTQPTRRLSRWTDGLVDAGPRRRNQCESSSSFIAADSRTSALHRLSVEARSEPAASESKLVDATGLRARTARLLRAYISG